MTRTSKRLMAALGILLGAAACNNDQLYHNSTMDPVDPLFARYVSFGNSITAGFQSAGINDSTQIQSYARRLAIQMHSPFAQPLMARPGCPPPYTNVFTQARVGGAASNDSTCALRLIQQPTPPYINDVAVPGAGVISPTNNLDSGASNILTSFMLGGLTQIGMARRVLPTFVTVWIGNNDVLGALTDLTHPGDTVEVTDTTTFKAEYTALLDSIDLLGSVKGGVLIGVADVTQIPYASLGMYYLGAKSVPPLSLLPSFQVSPDCAPSALGGVGDSSLVPFWYGLGLIQTAQADPTGGPYTLDCVADNDVVTKPELVRLHGAVVAYNAFISAQANSRGYGYLDPNLALAQLKADTTQVAYFPHAPPDPRATTAPFGTAFTFDGVHPSGATHKLVANALIQVINAKYGTALAPIP